VQGAPISTLLFSTIWFRRYTEKQNYNSQVLFKKYIRICACFHFFRPLRLAAFRHSSLKQFDYRCEYSCVLYEHIHTYAWTLPISHCLTFSEVQMALVVCVYLNGCSCRINSQRITSQSGRAHLLRAIQIVRKMGGSGVEPSSVPSSICSLCRHLLLRSTSLQDSTWVCSWGILQTLLRMYYMPTCGDEKVYVWYKILSTYSIEGGGRA